MLAGGLGTVRPQHALKDSSMVQPGSLIIVLGGPAMLIGLGGGAASSQTSADGSADLDYASVQRTSSKGTYLFFLSRMLNTEICLRSDYYYICVFQGSLQYPRTFRTNSGPVMQVGTPRYKGGLKRLSMLVWPWVKAIPFYSSTILELGAFQMVFRSLRTTPDWAPLWNSGTLKMLTVD